VRGDRGPHFVRRHYGPRVGERFEIQFHSFLISHVLIQIHVLCFAPGTVYQM
jgi:hypothetical protein